MIARRIMFRGVVVLVCSLTASGAAQQLTERQVLQLFRESPYHRELRAGIDVVRAGTLRHDLYPNPSVSATYEGAGRTDFFLVEQPLLVNGRVSLLRKAARSAVRAAETGADHALRESEALLRRSFYQLAYAQSRKELIRECKAEMEDLADILRKREVAGESSRLDRLRVERAIVELETESAEADAIIHNARAHLAGFLGESVHPSQLAANGALEASYGLPSLEEAFGTALSARSDYKVETARLEQLRLEGEAADRLRIPNPVVSGGLKRAEIGGQHVNGPVLAVSIGLPLFNKGQAERALAEAESARARARQSFVEHQILADVRAAHGTLQLRRQIAREYRLSVGSRTAEILEIALVSYREGELGILDLLDAFREAQRTKLRQLELLASAKLAEVEFDRSMAKDLLQ